MQISPEYEWDVTLDLLSGSDKTTDMGCMNENSTDTTYFTHYTDDSETELMQNPVFVNFI